VPSDAVQAAFQKLFMPTAIFLSRVSAANAFCSAICDAELEGSAGVTEPKILLAHQARLQFIIGAFQENRDAANPNRVLDLQRFTSEFDGICAELNARNDVLRPLLSDCADDSLAGSPTRRGSSCVPKRPVLAAWWQCTISRVNRWCS
jgi:hypothetical protein